MARIHESVRQLNRVGIEWDDACALRRISMMLHRWHELECGVGNGCVERDEETGKCYWHNSMTGTRSPIADRERPALKRLDKIMARYPGFASYVQGDPRGCALYILPPDLLASRDPRWIEANYNRGVAVYK